MQYKQLYPSSLATGEGLIYAISNISGVPWSDISDDEKRNLEQAYYVRSGFKIIIDSVESLDAESRAKVIAAYFKQKWTRLWNIFSLEYNPLDAYKVTESGNKTLNVNRTQVDKYGKSVLEGGTDTGTVTTTGSDTENSTDSVYGFNSPMSLPSDATVTDSTADSTETRNLSTSKNTTNSGQDETTRSGSDREEYGYTKTGNIGYTSPQELIRRDIELWSSPFFKTVFDDIDSLITISVY